MAIEFSKARKGRDGFVGFSQFGEIGCSFEFFLAFSEHLRADAGGLGHAHTFRHPGEDRWIRAGKNGKSFRRSLTKKPGAHVVLLIHGVAAFASTEGINIREDDIVWTFAFGEDFTLWRNDH